MRPTRRETLAGLSLLAAGPACAAPPATDAAAWTAYEARLNSRLVDAGGGRFDEAARDVLAATNRARSTAGAGALAWHDDLAAAARAHAADLARLNYVEHVTAEGFDPSHRFWLVARRTIGSPSENIAYHRGPQAPSAAAMMALWRKSPRHWENMLRASHTHAGFGLVRRGERNYLVGLYARPLAELPDPLPFRAHRADLARAFRSLDPTLRAGLAAPQGAPLGKVEGAPPVLQITAARAVDERRYDVIGGPIFLASGAG